MPYSSNNNVGRVGESASKELFIYEIPPTKRRELCEHLDELDVWLQLADLVSLKKAEVQSIKRHQQLLDNSPSDELLKIWGSQYNHTVTELFMVFRKLKLYQAMRLIKDFVGRKYHILIPDSQPALGVLMSNKPLPDNTEHSRNLIDLNSDPSGLSNSVNALSTTDNNYSIPESYTSRSLIEPHQQQQQQQQGQGQGEQDQHNRSNYLSARNVREYASSILEINYAELTEATDQWNENFVLGKGGFGTVFRGYWKHTEVAIKQIHYRGADGQESVKVQIQQSLNELKYLNSCRHDNVLPLYGYSIKGEKPCLVYQLMKGGSLEQRLNSKNLAPLTWQQRINICLGTARGINYLHTFRDKPLIHGDIKPANVLLDQCLQPKIGDFGLAREGPNAINSAVQVTRVFGTKPYLPPEFLNSRKLSTQVDTYSFGVVLLETFTGLRVYDKNRAHPLLTKHIMKLCATAAFQLEDLIDKRVPLQGGEQEFCKLILQLGLTCIADSPQHRPEMEQVLKAITSYYKLSNFMQ